MTRWNRRLLWISFICAAILAAVVLHYIRSGVSDAIASQKPALQGLRKQWLSDGSPAKPPLKKYVADWTEPDRFMTWTNAYRIGDQTFESLVAVDDLRFEGKGILVISK